MNSRELRYLHKVYDLLSIRQRLDILKNVKDIQVFIRTNTDKGAGVLVTHIVAGTEIASKIMADTTTPPKDELDDLEYRLAYKTLDHLLGVHNGK